MSAAEVRRSVLFTPGDHEARMLKAFTLGADTVCFDLEDAVAPEDKETARHLVARMLEMVPASASERCVRINALASDEWRSDLSVVMRGRPDAVMVPKAQDPVALARFVQELTDAEVAAGRTAQSTKVLLVVETALGVLKALEVGQVVGQRLGALLFGAEDLAADAGLVRTRDSVEVLYARSRVALAAAALGVNAIDQVFVDFKDVQALEAEARVARMLGYSGKMAIHPDQLAPIHRAFTPSVAEVERALRLLQAAHQAGGGVFRFEGRMIDAPLLIQARRVVKAAERAGLLAPS